MNPLALLGDYTVQTVVMGAALLGSLSGVLGSFAVLRGQSLLGDALAHAALPGICIGFLIAGGRNLPAILGGALVSGTLAALVILMLTRRSRLKGDAALGSTLSLFFALGVVLLTAIQNRGDASQAGLESFLFGQAAALLRRDLGLMAAVTLVALLLVASLWKEFELVTFDRGFAASLGLPIALLEGLLTVMIAVAVVVGLQMVGVVLMAAMLIAPAAAARQWVRRLGRMVVLAAVFGAASGIVGALVSALGPGLATGPVVVLAASALVLVSILFAPERGLLPEVGRRRSQRRRLRSAQLLATLHRLASDHGDPRYPTEASMLDLYWGGPTRQTLDRLEQRGLVAPAAHMPEEGRHVVLTDAGVAAAEEAIGHGSFAHGASIEGSR